jgi:tol-pal system protein YbgF
MLSFAQWCLRTSAPVLAVGLILAATFLSSNDARAQSSVENLNAKVERLQREVTDLQRAFYRSGGTATTSGSESGGAVASGDPATARMAVRISEIESQLRNLTGEVEQLSFRMRQLSQQLETLAGDTDYRLQLLEKGTASTKPAEDVQMGAAAGSGVAAGGASSGSSSDAGAENLNARQPRTLGQVSQDDVNAMRQQGGAADAGASAAAGSGSAAGSQTASVASPSTGGAYQLPDGTPEDQYRHAFGLLRQMNYAEAELALAAFLDQHPDHRLAGNAKYWLGETYYVRGDYRQAAVAFAEGFKDYPDSNKAADNLLKLGISLGELGRAEDACGALSELLNRYPDLSENLRQRAMREQQNLDCG